MTISVKLKYMRGVEEYVIRDVYIEKEDIINLAIDKVKLSEEDAYGFDPIVREITIKL